MTDVEFVHMIKQDWFVANGISEACKASRQIAYTDAQCHMAIAAANSNATAFYVFSGLVILFIAFILFMLIDMDKSEKRLYGMANRGRH